LGRAHDEGDAFLGQGAEHGLSLRHRDFGLFKGTAHVLGLKVPLGPPTLDQLLDDWPLQRIRLLLTAGRTGRWHKHLSNGRVARVSDSTIRRGGTTVSASLMGRSSPRLRVPPPSPTAVP